MKTTMDPRTVSPPFRRDDSTDGGDLLSKLARAGLVARGFVYGVIGALAIGLAAGAGGKTTSQTGALKTIAHEPVGTVALIALTIGLAAYAAWQILKAACGVEAGERMDAGDRLSALTGGVAYAFLCGVAVEILLGSSPSGGGARQETAGVLGWPGGPVYVAVVGVVLFGTGLYQGYKGAARKFCEDSRVSRMSPAVRRTFTALGVAGYCSRGVTFALIGYGLVKAAIDYSPRSAVGLDGALQELIHASYGPLLLGIVAAGFIAFALFSIADARYHRV
ncbi:MAG TPA: DUF1206 domain-containing protein [Solirubrobacteraceae bacterium]|nr:DUF1206 domain-containing protein [Solirubrobacteraceae bacterium]